MPDDIEAMCDILDRDMPQPQAGVYDPTNSELSAASIPSNNVNRGERDQDSIFPTLHCHSNHNAAEAVGLRAYSQNPLMSAAPFPSTQPSVSSVPALAHHHAQPGRSRPIQNGGMIPSESSYYGATSLDPVRDNSTEQELPEVQRCKVAKDTVLQAAVRRRKNEAKFTCDIAGCGQTFTTRHNLRYHSDAHYNIRRYKCEMCGKSFTTLSDRRRHQHRHGIAA
ncbi:hypothetical protein WG66_007617 [Moniliophthora roreri]|nr:hypothetical protein WG66_007617 [Moniliophthora roreri]